MTESSKRSGRSWRGQRGELTRGVLLAGGLFALIVGGVLVTSAGDAGARGRWGCHHDRDHTSKHVAFFTSWLLDRVDASDEQEAQVQEIIDRTFGDMGSLKDALGAEELRGELIAGLTAETIDADELELLRKRKLELLDNFSRQLVVALVEIGEALDPEQRRELAALADRHHGRHH